jgi:hypothetical protein
MDRFDSSTQRQQVVMETHLLALRARMEFSGAAGVVVYAGPSGTRKRRLQSCRGNGSLRGASALDTACPRLAFVHVNRGGRYKRIDRRQYGKRMVGPARIDRLPWPATITHQERRP